MARGRPADPTRAKRGTGNRPKAGEGKQSPTEVVPLGQLHAVPTDDDGIPEVFAPPEEFVGFDVEAIWRTAVRELYPRGLRPADLEVIRQMCNAALRARQAASNIEAHGMVVQTERGMVVNPMLKVEKDATATYLRLADAMGLTMAARLRLGLMQVMGESVLQSLNRDLDMG